MAAPYRQGRVGRQGVSDSAERRLAFCAENGVNLLFLRLTPHALNGSQQKVHSGDHRNNWLFF